MNVDRFWFDDGAGVQMVTTAPVQVGTPYKESDGAGAPPIHPRNDPWEQWHMPQPDTPANDNALPELPSTNPKRAFGVRKPSPQFVPPVAIIEESVVMALGAAKYGAYNWQDDPVDATTYYSAALRHLLSWFAGEDKDPESGASHLAHVRACMAILIDASSSGTLIDDRPKCASASEAIERLKQDVRAA